MSQQQLEELPLARRSYQACPQLPAAAGALVQPPKPNCRHTSFLLLTKEMCEVKCDTLLGVGQQLLPYT